MTTPIILWLLFAALALPFIAIAILVLRAGRVEPESTDGLIAGLEREAEAFGPKERMAASLKAFDDDMEQKMRVVEEMMAECPESKAVRRALVQANRQTFRVVGR